MAGLRDVGSAVLEQRRGGRLGGVAEQVAGAQGGVLGERDHLLLACDSLSCRSMGGAGVARLWWRGSGSRRSGSPREELEAKIDAAGARAAAARGAAWRASRMEVQPRPSTGQG